MRKCSRVYTELELEEVSRLSAVITAEASYCPGEPATYYPDGSACPPSGGELSAIVWFVESLLNADGEDVYHAIKGAGWRSFAIRALRPYVKQHWDQVREALRQEGEFLADDED